MLVSSCGQNAKDFVSKIMKRLMVDQVAMQFNLLGKGEMDKKPFAESPVYSVLFREYALHNFFQLKFSIKGIKS